MQILILQSVYGLTGLLSNQKSQILLNFIFLPSLSSLVTNFEHGDNPTTNHTYEYLLGDQRSSKFGLI